MPDAEESLDPYYEPARRLAMFFNLIAEGLIEDKEPEQITEADFDLVDGRLLLEDIANADGVSVEAMIEGWVRDFETATEHETVEDLMAWLQDDPSSKSDIE